MWGRQSPGQSGRSCVWPPLLWGVVTKTGEEQMDDSHNASFYLVCSKRPPWQYAGGLQGSQQQLLLFLLFQFVFKLESSCLEIPLQYVYSIHRWIIYAISMLTIQTNELRLLADIRITISKYVVSTLRWPWCWNAEYCVLQYIQWQ